MNSGALFCQLGDTTTIAFAMRDCRYYIGDELGAYAAKYDVLEKKVTFDVKSSSKLNRPTLTAQHRDGWRRSKPEGQNEDPSSPYVVLANSERESS